jgi:hypothetical protein
LTSRACGRAAIDNVDVDGTVERARQPEARAWSQDQAKIAQQNLTSLHACSHFHLK